MSMLGIPQMCKEFHCTNEELMKFVHQGMPHTGRGSNMKFNLKTCQAWYSGELDEIQGSLKNTVTELTRIIGTLQSDIEIIIKSVEHPEPNAPPLDMPTLITMLKLAISHSDKECALIAERLGKEAKTIC